MKKTHQGKSLALSFSDATKAYFNAKPTRDLVIKASKELGLPANTVGHLLRFAYDTRDAGAQWEERYAQLLIGMGFERGRARPTCFFYHQHGKLLSSYMVTAALRYVLMTCCLYMRPACGKHPNRDCRVGQNDVQWHQQLLYFTSDVHTVMGWLSPCPVRTWSTATGQCVHCTLAHLWASL